MSRAGPCASPDQPMCGCTQEPRATTTSCPSPPAPSADDDPSTVAYYGTRGAPGFGLAAAYTGQEFSLVISDTDTADAVACGDLLEPDDDKFTEAGLALVQLAPLDDSGVQGFALIERAPHASASSTSPRPASGSCCSRPVTTQ